MHSPICSQVKYLVFSAPDQKYAALGKKGLFLQFGCIYSSTELWLSSVVTSESFQYIGLLLAREALFFHQDFPQESNGGASSPYVAGRDSQSPLIPQDIYSSSAFSPFGFVRSNVAFARRENPGYFTFSRTVCTPLCSTFPRRRSVKNGEKLRMDFSFFLRLLFDSEGRI